jgi:hypothetical protein
VTGGATHVLGDGEGGDIIAEEAEFGLNPAPAPGGVVSGHTSNQGADLEVDRWTTRCASSGLPAPVEAKAVAVPSDDSGGLDNKEAGPPVRPEPREANPEDAVVAAKPRVRERPLQDHHLMAQGDVLQRHGGGAAEKGTEEGPDAEDEDHCSSQG